MGKKFVDLFYYTPVRQKWNGLGKKYPKELNPIGICRLDFPAEYNLSGERIEQQPDVDNLSTVQNESAGSEPPAEIAWDGTLEGETIELKEDEE